MPARQSRAALSNVARAPHDAQLVDLVPRLVVGAEDVELALADLIELGDGRWVRVVRREDRWWTDGDVMDSVDGDGRCRVLRDEGVAERRDSPCRERFLEASMPH